jgi:hypothetical protein
MTHSPVILAVWAGLVLAWAGPVRAEDAVRFSDATAQPGGSVTVDVIIVNDLVIAGAFVQCRWSSPDLTLDSIEYIRDRYLGSLSGHGTVVSGGDRIAWFMLLGSISQLDPRGLINSGSGAVARLWFRVSPQAASQWVTIDTVYAKPNDELPPPNFSDVSGLKSIWPNIYPGTVTIGHPSGQASITVVPDRLEFHGVRDGSPLPPQSVSIRSVNGPRFTWAVSSTAEWLSVSPAAGSSPGELQVGVDLAALGAGDYLDTITISSPEAVNSPVRLPVMLRVEAATEMVVTPARLDFQSVVRGPNPPLKTLYLDATNDVPLAWSAQWSSTWLVVNPDSSDQLGQVRVGVDAVTLDTGGYSDTIVFTARGAANSPVRIPVVLVVDTTASIPPSNALFQNRPNPFSTYHDPATSIAYVLEKSDHVDITLYDVLGRPVRHLVSDDMGAGPHTKTWDGRDDHGHMVASGHYFYRMKTSGSMVTRKMVVIK